jgi:hypothetical protein
MSRRAAAIGLIAGLTLSSCGSGTSDQAVPDRTYHVKLAAMPGAFFPMAPHGSTEATIRVVGARREICWTFGRPSGFTDPTRAEIRLGGPGEYGSLEVALGSRYSPTGCSRQVAARALRAIVTSPQGSYVEIDSWRFPSIGAVRAQL